MIDMIYYGLAFLFALLVVKETPTMSKELKKHQNGHAITVICRVVSWLEHHLSWEQ